MPNPQQQELARSRKAASVSDEAAPTKAQRRTRKGAATDAPGPIPEDNAPGHTPDVVPDKPLLPPEPYRLHAADDLGGSGVAEPEVEPDRDDAAGGPAEPSSPGSSVRFGFRFDRLLLPASAVFGVTPLTASVTLDDDRLVVRFGPWSLTTDRANIAGAEVTGPYNVLKIAGPPHLSLKDRGVTFATSRHQGTCIRFHEPVRALAPFGPLRHPAATVTVTNPGDLARRLRAGG